MNKDVTTSSQKPSATKPSIPLGEKAKQITRNVLRSLITFTFWIFEIGLIIFIVINLLEIGKLQIAKFLPTASYPVARFLTKVDWKSRTIEFNASPSKTYNNKVERYIWRIDDGASSMAGNTFTHTFQEPGLYEILFSIVDTNGQSDQADCRVLFPPSEVEQIAMSERIQESTNAKEVSYKWVPKGTFFNYSKLNSNTIGDLRSPYVETGCGFSDNSYNSYDVYQNVSDRNLVLRHTALRTTIGLLAMAGIFILYSLLKKKLRV